MGSESSYTLGSSDLEHQRLMIQARLLRPWTDRFLLIGGLAPGMSVLDLGSGIGDVTQLAAAIVGPAGRVIGIDRDEVITTKARRRVANEALIDTVSFQVADLADYEPDGPIDAIVGRYILLYQQYPAALLRRYARFLRPGGVLIFHELNMVRDSPSWPPCAAWDDCMQLATQAYLATGSLPDVGRKLSNTFVAAGLSWPVVEAVTPIASTPDSPILDWIARTLVSLRPVLTRIEAPVPSRLDYDDLRRQWRAAIADGAQLQAPEQYGAWIRVP